MKYWIILCIGFIANSVYAEKGLLWQIDKAGHSPSYIFGTIHSEDPRVTTLPNIVRTRFEQAHSVSVEVLMDRSTILKSLQLMLLTKPQTLEQLVKPTLFTQIIAAMHQHDIPLPLLKQMKPWAIIMMLNVPPVKTGEFLDLLLYKKAQKHHIPLYGLETIEEQLSVFESFTIPEQVLLLKDTLKYVDEMPALFDKMHTLYLSRDLTALLTLGNEYMKERSDYKSLADAFYKRILDDRNIRMIARMAPRLQEGNAFIAVGALHLPGEKGLLALLQKQGYRVFAIY
ncbi:MAG: TraB/GumN family protein [Thiomargarita sp.]|nr:TraB/GumN family protein [Thiomargarita sp.]